MVSIAVLSMIGCGSGHPSPPVAPAHADPIPIRDPNASLDEQVGIMTPTTVIQGLWREPIAYEQPVNVAHMRPDGGGWAPLVPGIDFDDIAAQPTLESAIDVFLEDFNTVQVRVPAAAHTQYRNQRIKDLHVLLPSKVPDGSGGWRPAELTLGRPVTVEASGSCGAVLQELVNRINESGSPAHRLDFPGYPPSVLAAKCSVSGTAPGRDIVADVLLQLQEQTSEPWSYSVIWDVLKAPYAPCDASPSGRNENHACNRMMLMISSLSMAEYGFEYVMEARASMGSTAWGYKVPRDSKRPRPFWPSKLPDVGTPPEWKRQHP